MATEIQTRQYLANINESLKDAIITKLVSMKGDLLEIEIDWLAIQIQEFDKHYGAWTINTK